MTNTERPKITIARATYTEVDDVARLFDEYRQFYGQPSDVDGAGKFLSQRLKLNESVILLARRAAQAIGFVQLYPSFSSIAMRRIWILNDLYVSPAGRRAGIAAALLDAACELAAEADAVRVELATAKDNDTARKLYASNNWQEDEVFVHYQRSV